MENLPAAGEIKLFDRSWYNRAGVEKVMGFCTPDEYRRFLHQAPIFERLLVEDGIVLRKYWFSVSDAEQERRFKSRMHDPMRQWKLSPMDLESITRWEEYSRAKDEMLVHTDIPEAPWYVVEADDKRRARLNMIHHLLSTIPYFAAARPPLDLPHRPGPTGYERPPRELNHYVPDYAAEAIAKHEKYQGREGPQGLLACANPCPSVRHWRSRGTPREGTTVMPALGMGWLSCCGTRAVTALTSGVLSIACILVSNPAAGVASSRGGRPTPTSRSRRPARVNLILDGDTFRFVEDGASSWIKIRLLGVNTPEVTGFDNVHFDEDMCGGQEALQLLRTPHPRRVTGPAARQPQGVLEPWAQPAVRVRLQPRDRTVRQGRAGGGGGVRPRDVVHHRQRVGALLPLSPDRAAGPARRDAGCGIPSTAVRSSSPTPEST